MARGVSIHIGLNSLDENHYKLDGELQFKRLTGCVKDAKIMQRIAKSQGFETKLFVTDAQTDPAQLHSDIILGRIRSYAGVLGEGDIFLITFSGHGSQINNIGNDFEREGRDQTWCFYDRMIIDDELAQLWSLFNPGVRILFISDSCHSGSVFFMPLMEAAVSSKTKLGNTCKSLKLGKVPFDEFEFVSVDDESREITRGAARSIIVNNREEIYRPVFQRLSQDLADAQADAFNKLVKARLISISACQDFETARDGTNNGVFTAALKKVWFGTDTPADDQVGGFQGGYLDFFEAVRQATTGANNSQNPNFFPFSIEDDLRDFPLIDRNGVEEFISSNPFKI